ncbi:TetR/AcrR family transcriptional regulator [Anoxybacillus sp. D401a]|uniref:TetR/AcrR family transcriptional regulator n=1 Tax=Anoxybacillus sp. D401a TaxID=575112 RepID=UPI003D34801E
MMKRERQKKQTRILLQQTALQLFQKQGYEQTTVLQITNEAGVAKGTFFNYFRTKEEVLHSVFFSHIERICEKMMNDNNDWRQKIDRVFYELATMHEQLGREVAKAVLHIYTGKTKEGHCLAPLHDVLTRLFEEGKRSGHVRAKQSAAALAHIAMQLYVGALHLWMFSYVTESLATFMTNAWNMFAHYIEKEGD